MKEVKDLITKAAEAKTPSDAMMFAQAALNAANALRSLQEVQTERAPERIE